MDNESRDYVIVQELLHFSVPIRGKLRNRPMTAHREDYRERVRRLGAQQ